jgi:hypothetical protein
MSSPFWLRMEEMMAPRGRSGRLLRTRNSGSLETQFRHAYTLAADLDEPSDAFEDVRAGGQEAPLGMVMSLAESPTSSRSSLFRHPYAWLAAVVAIYLALALPVVFFGRVTADEGWYLLASVNVARGQQPYRDFLLTQMPLLPYVYAAFLSVVGQSLVAARLVSMLFGLGGLVLAMASLRRRAGVFAAVLGGLLLALDLAVTFDASVLKTQSLTLLLTGLAIWLAAGSGRWFEIVGSIVAMTLAVLTRLSMLPALACFCLFWLAGPKHRRAVGLLATAVSAVMLAASAWFFWAGGNAWFGVYDFHHVYFAGMSTEGGFGWFFLQGFLSNQMPIVVAGLSALALLGWRWWKSGTSGAPWVADLPLLALLLGSYLSTTTLHATRVVAYPTYQTSNVLFLVVLTGIVLGRAAEAKPRVHAATLAAAVLLALLGMPWQEYVVHRDGMAAPGKVAEATAVLARLPQGNRRILTLAPELAVGAHLDLLAGYEMGTFSYFPLLGDAQAEQLHVANTVRVQRDLAEQRASILALTPRALGTFSRGIEPHELRRLIDSHYNLAAVVKGYGQYAEELYLFSAKDERAIRE